MGGKFPQGKEANFYRPDPQSTSYCVRNWEKEVIFCGQEVGNNVITGGKKLKDKLNPRHPLYRAYELYNGFAGRQSWDQIAIMQLISQSGNFFSYVDGHCLVASDGSNGWENDISGNHHYVILKPHTENSHISNYIDSLMTGTVLSPQRNLSNRQPNDPVRLILDTDMLTGCDDIKIVFCFGKKSGYF